MKNPDILKEIPLFSCLEDDQLLELSEIMVETTYREDTIIIQKGDTSRSLYVVLSGFAIATDRDEDGKLIFLNEFEQGDYFGEMSFIDGKPRCANVETEEETRLIMLPGDKFRKIIFSNPDMMLNMMKGLLEKLRKATEQIYMLAFLDVYGRIRHLLTEISEPYQGKTRIIRGRPRHHEIATRVNSSREMVTRIVREISEGGYITVCKDCIIINKKLPESL